MAGNKLTPKGRELPRATDIAPGEMDPLREFEVTVFELERLVRCSRGRTFYIRAAWDAACIDKPMSTRYISGNVRVTKREMLRFIKSTYNNSVDRVYARVTLCSNCFFIGG